MAIGREQSAINTIRMLSIDGVEKANAGHPGLPMGAAPMAYVLWTKVMNHNPENPSWFNRDRFILSAGHGSMLLYSMLHLCAYDLPLEELKQFRQWGSRTPGHPEFGHTTGVEATTGPLGQGLAMGTGMAMAERHLAAKYNTEDHAVIDHFTYVLCGDGDLMEGVSSEAASLAGHLKLGNLVVLYDSNDISLDGNLNQSFSENVLQRYESYGWHTVFIEDGNDIDAIEKAMEEARKSAKPSMIEVKTVIGYGSPNKGGTNAAHGAPIGGEEYDLVREAYQWEYEPFQVPPEVTELFTEVKASGAKTEQEWEELFSSYKQENPKLAAELEQAIAGELPEDWDANLPVFNEEKTATRAASGDMLQEIAVSVPALFGGSADLSGSNKTLLKAENDFSQNDYAGRNIWFGVREFAMAAAINGIQLHGALKPFGSTFLVFSDYLRPALRLSALMELPVTHVFTHDSIAVGEDGPTHEPVEHLASLRAVPNLNVIRPADGNETAAAWRAAMESQKTPTALVLTRQGVPTLEDTKYKAAEGVRKGAYVIGEQAEHPDLLLIAAGSEVSLAVDAKVRLQQNGLTVNVVSMPSFHAFDQQSATYRKSVLPDDDVPAMAVEMGSSLGWYKYVGSHGTVYGIDRFGASAPGGEVVEKYGFTPEDVAEAAGQLIEK